jgi:ABC-type multidrug transport system fused ATPase/permease subunit
MSGVLCEKIRIMPLVKLFARERSETRHYSALMKSRIKQEFKLWHLQTILERTRGMFESGSSIVLTCFIWFSVMRGFMSLGSAMALSMYLGMILPPFLAFATILQGLIAGLVPSERVLTFFQQPEESGRALMEQNGAQGPLAITFDRVGFSYDGKGEVFRDLQLIIPAGHIIAFVGPSGSGKTTLLNLICSLYLPDRGRVLLGESSTQSVSPQCIRQMVSVAPQEAVLFSGTVRENILYGDPGVSDEKILKAVELACAREFIELLPDKFDTKLHSEHTTLSVGQKHRLTLARAFVRNSSILLLDEPFANVDSEIELRLWYNLLSLRRRQTVIVVTHRYPPRGVVDQLYCLEHGSISMKLNRECSPMYAGRESIACSAQR